MTKETRTYLSELINKLEGMEKDNAPKLSPLELIESVCSTHDADKIAVCLECLRLSLYNPKTYHYNIYGFNEDIYEARKKKLLEGESIPIKIRNDKEEFIIKNITV